MKARKFLNMLVVVMIAMTSFGFVSCGSDDETEETKTKSSMLIGTWHMDSSTIDDRHGWAGNTTTFLPDGTLVRKNDKTNNAMGYSMPDDIYTGKYSYNETTNILTCSYKRIKKSADYYGENTWNQVYNVMEISETRLVVTGVGVVDGRSLQFTFFFERQ